MFPLPRKENHPVKRYLMMALTLFLMLWDAGVAARQPNIVLIMTDDMGFECLSVYGSTSYKTPRLDQMAAKGMRFDHCYSQPLCTPTRVKIMTGQYNFRNYRQFGRLDPAQKTFGHALKAAGYKTAIAGKWQLGHDKSLPAHFGFDEYCLWQLTYERKEGERFANPLIERNGETLPRDKDAYGPRVFADFAVDFISRNQEEPFFFYFPMVLVHNPFVPTPDTPEWDKVDRYKKDKKHFADMMAYTDKVVGRLVDHVASLGLAEDTLFLFTGDNGTNRSITSMLGDRKIVGGKGKMTDAGTRVPFIAYWPGHIEAGGVHQGLVGFEDFFPTLLDVAGITDYSASKLDGRSILPILRGEQFAENPWLYCHYDPRWGRINQWRGRSARTTRYKLFADGRFYDLQQDPDESQPLDAAAIGDEGRAVRAKLQGVLDDMEKQGSVLSAEGAP